MSATQTLSDALSGRYRIERELGAGGMATVYLAHDLRHERDVAIKVLHPDLGAALGGERFLSEIKTTAKLQHPHILPLLDSGDAGGLLYYVMPLARGETLRARLTRERQLPIDDALRIAREVADALQYAHTAGIVHRDIKPENILLEGGHALVADFGIALAVQTAGGARMTQTGLSLGTPQYMSPEQAMGERTIDARSDIYALGAVTYEMLAGDPPFTGSSVQAIVAKIISEKPTSLRTLRDTVSPGVEHAVLTALAKLPADRFATAAQFATALTSPTAESSSAWATTVSHRGLGARMIAPLGVALVVASGLAVWGWLRPQSPAQPVTRVAIALPPAQEMRPQFWGFGFDVSPDGGRLAYVGPGPSAGTTQVWIRPLDALDANTLAATTGALGVQWSPDGRAVLVLLSRQEAVVVSIDGRQVVPLRNITDATWGADGRIYSDRQDRFLLRQTVGGVADTLFQSDTAFTIGQPMPLPGGDGVLFVRTGRSADNPTASEIVALSLATKRLSVVTRGVYARFLKSGALMFASPDGGVFVAPFDQSTLALSGPAVPFAHVALGANAGRSYPQISVADDGTIVYMTGDLRRQRLAWLDANGRLTRRLASEGDFWGISLSPDGSRAAYTLRTDNRDPRAAARGTGDVWVEELATGAKTRLTTEWFNLRPSWSPDGKSVLYSRISGPGNQALLERRADASEPERLVLAQKEFGHSIGDARWLPDHRTLVVRTYEDAGSLSNLYSTVSGGTGAPRPFATTPATETAPSPSPDGTLVAYLSDETRTYELYVERFPSGGERLVVSKGGVSSVARWSRDGRSLYFWDQRGKLMVASIVARPTLAVTGLREINADVTPGRTGPPITNATFDVTADGRILIAEELRGAFDLVLVRNGMVGLGKAGGK